METLAHAIARKVWRIGVRSSQLTAEWTSCLWEVNLLAIHIVDHISTAI